MDGSSHSQLLAKTLLDDKPDGEVGLFMMLRQLVHPSREEHDLYRLIACGLCGVVKMK
jgi:hypothetical protein